MRVKGIFTTGRYAAVTSTLALVVALSGTAYAVATVTSADIVNSTIRSIDIRDGTVARTDLATTSLGSAPRIFAQVSGAGVLGNEAGTTSSTRQGVGRYTVTFDRSVATCAVIGTGQSLGTEQTVQTVVNGAVVSVEVKEEAEPADGPFHLAAIC